MGTSGDRRREVAVDDEAAAELFDVLSSAPARELLAHLQERPATAAELASANGIPREDVYRHLSALSEAGLVETVATTDDETGRPVDVYGPTDSAVVHYGDDGTGSVARTALVFVAGGVAVAAATTLVWTRLGGWTVGIPFFLGAASVLVGWCLLDLIETR